MISGLAAVVVLVLLPSYGVAKLAERKGRNFAAWFVASVLFSWVMLLIAALVMRPRPAEGGYSR